MDKSSFSTNDPIFKSEAEVQRKFICDRIFFETISLLFLVKSLGFSFLFFKFFYQKESLSSVFSQQWFKI